MGSAHPASLLLTLQLGIVLLASLFLETGQELQVQVFVLPHIQQLSLTLCEQTVFL
jgi:hypothetical protein